MAIYPHSIPMGAAQAIGPPGAAPASGGGSGAFNWGPPLAIAFGVGGALMSGLAAAARNKSIRRAAEINMGRLNDFITQVRVDRHRRTEALARAGKMALGGVLNQAPHNMAVILTLASRIVSNVARDQFAIDEEAIRREKAAGAEKQAIANQAASGMSNIGLEVLQGGVRGAGAGMSFGAALNQLAIDQELTDLAADLGISRGELTKMGLMLSGAKTATERAYGDLVSERSKDFTGQIDNSDTRAYFQDTYFGGVLPHHMQKYPYDDGFFGSTEVPRPSGGGGVSDGGGPVSGGANLWMGNVQ